MTKVTIEYGQDEHGESYTISGGVRFGPDDEVVGDVRIFSHDCPADYLEKHRAAIMEAVEDAAFEAAETRRIDLEDSGVEVFDDEDDSETGRGRRGFLDMIWDGE